LEVYHSRSEQFASTELSKEQHRQRVEAVVNNSPTELQPWVKERLAFSNQKTLAQRIDDLSRSNAKELEKLAAGFPDFAAKVRYTRNYYTHYSEDLKRAGKVATGVELMKLGFVLEDLLEICLLKEIGVEGKAIARILKRASGMKFVRWIPVKCSQQRTIPLRVSQTRSLWTLRFGIARLPHRPAASFQRAFSSVQRAA